MSNMMQDDVTLLFVSHSIAQVRDLCDKAVWLNQGQLMSKGEVNTVCNEFIDSKLLFIDRKIAQILEAIAGNDEIYKLIGDCLADFNKDKEFEEKPHTVSGMLLYAATDEAIQPDNSYQMSGNKISVKTLDLNKDFPEIAAQLNAIVDDHFG